MVSGSEPNRDTSLITAVLSLFPSPSHAYSGHPTPPSSVKTLPACVLHVGVCVQFNYKLHDIGGTYSFCGGIF